MMISMVVAYDLKRGIGADNDLLWHLPADMRHFKELTVGKSIIMGRKTYQSIGRPLPDRENIVLTTSDNIFPGVKMAANLSAAYKLAEYDIVIIGGGVIYEQTINDADVIYATEVLASIPTATIFFPELPKDWLETSRVHNYADAKNLYDYDFVTYKRPKPQSGL